MFRQKINNQIKYLLIMADLSDKVTIKVKCKHCESIYKLRVYPEDIDKYQSGELIQDAFPYLSSSERELIISGICPDCWDKMFAHWD